MDHLPHFDVRDLRHLRPDHQPDSGHPLLHGRPSQSKGLQENQLLLELDDQCTGK